MFLTFETFFNITNLWNVTSPIHLYYSQFFERYFNDNKQLLSMAIILKNSKASDISINVPQYCYKGKGIKSDCMKYFIPQILRCLYEVN